MRELLKLYLILESSLLRLPLEDFIVQAVEGGVTAIQLRDKSSTAIERYEMAMRIKPLLQGRDTLFIINNTVDIAIAAGAHGVHLGVDDLPPAAVRKHFPELIVGYSCNNSADVAVAIAADVHYAGVGPVYATASKADHRAPLGVEGVTKIAQALNKIPAAAIGGIDEKSAPLIRGTAGICVLSALCESETPYQTARNLCLLQR